MPFWYGACFLLLAVHAWLRRGTAAFPLLVTAAGLWLAGIGVVRCCAGSDRQQDCCGGLPLIGNEEQRRVG